MKDKTKHVVPPPDTEVKMGMAEGIKPEPVEVVVPSDPGKYFIVTFVPERNDFWVKEIDGSVSEDELFRKYIRGASIAGSFKIYKGREIKIRR